MMALIYGDLLMRVLYATRPYEKEPGSANALYEECCGMSPKNDNIVCRRYEDLIQAADADDRRAVSISCRCCDIKKPRVGVVGEILVKVSSYMPIMISWI